MCIPRPPRPAPPPSELPSTQAADNVELTAEDLNQTTPSGRLALSTRARSSRTAPGARTAATVATATGQQSGAAPDRAAEGGAAAGDFLFGGRDAGSRQPFFQETP